MDWIREQLDDAGLPTADLDTSERIEFLIAHGPGERPLGTVGIEPVGEHGLLRSLVIDPDARGLGVGKRLVASLEDHARTLDIRQLWLLTTDADGYFAALGFEPVARESVPDSIRGTAEFADLCPDTATVMVKSL